LPVLSLVRPIAHALGLVSLGHLGPSEAAGGPIIADAPDSRVLAFDCYLELQSNSLFIATVFTHPLTVEPSQSPDQPSRGSDQPVSP
jgi:hypothetical protein